LKGLKEERSGELHSLVITEKRRGYHRGKEGYHREKEGLSQRKGGDFTEKRRRGAQREEGIIAEKRRRFHRGKKAGAFRKGGGWAQM
jgi:hypothetical protein